MTRAEAAFTGARTALKAALSSWLLALVLVLPGWFDFTAEAFWRGTQWGTGLWLLAQGGSADITLEAAAAPETGVLGAQISTATVDVTPLGFTLVCALAAWWWMRRLGRALGVRYSKRSPQQRLVPLTTQAGFVVGYVSVFVLLTHLFSTDKMNFAVGHAWILAPMLMAGAATAGVWSAGKTPFAPGLVAMAPDVSMRFWRIGSWGAVAVALLLGAAGISVLAALVTGFSQVLHLREVIGAGVGGDFAFTSLQLAYVPNMVIYASAFLVGPGFGVGVDSVISPQGVSSGPLPAIPLLGLIPESTGTAAWIYGSVAVPVVTGMLLGWWVVRWVRRRRSINVLTLMVDTLGAAAWAGFGVAALAWSASGSLGPGRLAFVGVDAAVAGTIFAIEVLAACWAVIFTWWAIAVLRSSERRTIPGLPSRRSSSSAWPRPHDDELGFLDPEDLPRLL